MKKPHPTPPPAWLDIRGAAAYLTVSVPTIRRWIASGRLPARRVGDKVIRIRVADLEAFAEGVSATA